MTQAQKTAFDRLYAKFHNGAAHQQIKRNAENPIKADDAYAALIKTIVTETA